jgi:MFS family permease
VRADVLGMVVLAGFLVSLNWSTLYVALPVIVRHFHAGTLAATFIALTPDCISTALVLVVGRLGDLAGRTRLYVLGLVSFVVASLLLGAAPTVGWLIALEVCEGIGIALVWSNSAALIRDTQPAERLNRSFGLYAAATSLAQLLGPTVGGLLADTAGWRWVFWINVPVGVACVLWGRGVLLRQVGGPGWHRRARHRVAPHLDAGQRPRRPLDLPGGALLLVGMLGLVASLSLAESYGVGPGALVGSAASIGVLAVFVVVELGASDPLVDLSLFRDRVMSGRLLAGLLGAMALWVPVLIMALFFQAVQGRSPLAAGLEVMPLSVFAAVTAALTARVGSGIPRRTVTLTGGLLGSAGLASLAFAVSGDIAEIAAALALVGAGSGMFSSSYTNMLLAGAPAEHTGAVNGARLTIQNLGWMVSTVILLTIVTAPLAVGVRHELFAGTISHRASPAAAAALIGSYRTGFLVTAALGLAGSAALALCPRTRLRRSARSPVPPPCDPPPL